MAAEDGPQHLENEEVARQLELRFGTLQDGIYARLVEKVGDKMYWENWAKSVGEIAQKFIERIALLIKENDNARNYFKEFISGLHKNINDSIDEGQAIEMLAQHIRICSKCLKVKAWRWIRLCSTSSIPQLRTTSAT